MFLVVGGDWSRLKSNILYDNQRQLMILVSPGRSLYPFLTLSQSRGNHVRDLNVGGFLISLIPRMWRVKECETSERIIREEPRKPVTTTSSRLETDQQSLGSVPSLELPKRYIRVLARCRPWRLRELPQNLLTFQVSISEVSSSGRPMRTALRTVPAARSLSVLPVLFQGSDPRTFPWNFPCGKQIVT